MGFSCLDGCMFYCHACQCACIPSQLVMHLPICAHLSGMLPARQGVHRHRLPLPAGHSCLCRWKQPRPFLQPQLHLSAGRLQVWGQGAVSQRRKVHDGLKHCPGKHHHEHWCTAVHVRGLPPGTVCSTRVKRQTMCSGSVAGSMFGGSLNKCTGR